MVREKRDRIPRTTAKPRETSTQVVAASVSVMIGYRAKGEKQKFRAHALPVRIL